MAIGKTLVILITVFVAGFIMLNIHEIGHTIFARLLGDPQARYVLYQPGECIGCNLYDESKLSPWGNVLNSAAGLIVTQLVALGLVWLSRRRSRNPLARSALGTALVIFLLDVPVQVLQGLVADVNHQTHLTRVDMADVLYLLNSLLGTPVSVLKIALAGAGLLYLAIIGYLLRKPRPDNWTQDVKRIS